MSNQKTAIDINRLVKARDEHGKEAETVEKAIKDSINSAVSGIEVHTVCLTENKDDEFQFAIWGKITQPLPVSGC